MFSANSSNSPTRLKPLDVAKGRGNGVGLGGSDWEGWTGYGGVDEGMWRN